MFNFNKEEKVMSEEDKKMVQELKDAIRRHEQEAEDARYELLSGHRRYRACQIAGLDTLRCEVVEMSLDEATIFMVESNFQRTKILPSEKAFAYRMRLEAMNRQGKRTDLTSATSLQKSQTSRDIIGQSFGESGETVRKYIRLTELIPELLDMVDEGEIALRPAVELSYIPKLQLTSDETCYRYGYFWVKCTQKMMTVHIPFLTEDMVQHSVRKLLEKGIIKVAVLDDDKFDHTYWYTFTEYGEELLDDGAYTDADEKYFIGQ